MSKCLILNKSQIAFTNINRKRISINEKKIYTIQYRLNNFYNNDTYNNNFKRFETENNIHLSNATKKYYERLFSIFKILSSNVFIL